MYQLFAGVGVGWCKFTGKVGHGQGQADGDLLEGRHQGTIRARGPETNRQVTSYFLSCHSEMLTCPLPARVSLRRATCFSMSTFRRCTRSSFVGGTYSCTWAACSGSTGAFLDGRGVACGRGAGGSAGVGEEARGEEHRDERCGAAAAERLDEWCVRPVQRPRRRAADAVYYWDTTGKTNSVLGRGRCRPVWPVRGENM